MYLNLPLEHSYFVTYSNRNKITKQFCYIGKEKFQSFEGVSEASRCGERPECEATDHECHETDAAFG